MLQDLTLRAVLPAAKPATSRNGAVIPATHGRNGRSILGAMSLAAAILASGPALAQDRRTADIRVAYGDLDLSDAAAVRVLDGRLSRAILSSCPNDEAARGAARQRAIAECRARKRAEIEPLRQAALASATGRQNAFAAR